MNIVRSIPTPTIALPPSITDLSAFISHPFKATTTYLDQPKNPSADPTAIDPYSATQDSFLAYVSDTESASNAAVVQKLPVEIGSRFACNEGSGSVHCTGDSCYFGFCNAGHGFPTIGGMYGSVWLSGAVLGVEVVKLLGRKMCLGGNLEA